MNCRGLQFQLMIMIVSVAFGKPPQPRAPPSLLYLYSKGIQSRLPRLLSPVVWLCPGTILQFHIRSYSGYGELSIAMIFFGRLEGWSPLWDCYAGDFFAVRFILVRFWLWAGGYWVDHTTLWFVLFLMEEEIKLPFLTNKGNLIPKFDTLCGKFSNS